MHLVYNPLISTVVIIKRHRKQLEELSFPAMFMWNQKLIIEANDYIQVKPK